MSGQPTLAFAKVSARFAIAVLGLIRGYQFVISPLLGGRCKYHPTCSHYAVDAVREVGVVRGSILAGWRVCRCNPWSHGGVDTVSERPFFKGTSQ